jgi:hypothetical protein
LLITFSLPLAVLPFELPFELTLAESLLKEGSDRVSDTLKLLVALLFSGLEASGYMSTDERHGDCIRPGAISTARTDRGSNYGRKGSLRGKNEWAWGLTARRQRLGHEHERRGVAHPSERGKG